MSYKTNTESPYLALVEVITIALACMMLVIIVGQLVPEEHHLVPCVGHMHGLGGVKIDVLLECEPWHANF